MPRSWRFKRGVLPATKTLDTLAILKGGREDRHHASHKKKNETKPISSNQFEINGLRLVLGVRLILMAFPRTSPLRVARESRLAARWEEVTQTGGARRSRFPLTKRVAAYKP